MMYGSSAWVSTSVDNLNKVFRLQKHALFSMLILEKIERLTAEREVAGSIPGVGPILGVLK